FSTKHLSTPSLPSKTGNNLSTAIHRKPFTLPSTPNHRSNLPSRSSKQRPPRADLEAEFTRVQQTVAPVVHSWLDMFPPSSPQHIHEAISIARRLYIPDLTLALHTVYLDAGRLLHRQHYTKVLDLAVTIADSRNDSTLRAWR